ncbi:G-protein coupled receptor 83-like [Lineus longissimus]|uniref:G-protein coupled receptor 83-like n=1 Tax=Lineus longissimus TaxID=88925 RepID=UPI00315D8DBA
MFNATEDMLTYTSVITGGIGKIRNISAWINMNSSEFDGNNSDRPTQLLEDFFRRMQQKNVWTNVALAIVFSAIVLVSIFGNMMVVYVIVRNRRMHTVTNVFVTNLAVADLLITFLNIPFNIGRYILDDWPFGDEMCHVINFVQTVSVYAFTFTLTSIALDRQQVIMYPLSPRISTRLAFIIIGAIWLTASLLSVPFGMWYGLETMNLYFKQSLRCTKIFPSKDIERYIYLVTAITQYCIPLSVITVAYGRIAQRLWVRVQLGDVTEEQQLSHMRSKKKTIKMLIAVVLVFAISWLPLNIYYLVIQFPPSSSHNIMHSGKAVFTCYWIAMSSVSVNPFIYCWFNEAFRVEVINKFRCFVRQRRRIHPGYEIDGILFRSDQVRSRSLRQVHTSTLFNNGRAMRSTAKRPTQSERRQYNHLHHLTRMLPSFKSKTPEEREKLKCDNFLANGFKHNESSIRAIAEHPSEDIHKSDDESYDLEQGNNALKSEMEEIQIVITDLSDTGGAAANNSF